MSNELLTFEELPQKAREDGVVRLDDSENFFIIIPSAKKNSGHIKHTYGWKLHLSIHSEDVKKAFNLVVPIIYGFQLVFKVFNIAKYRCEDLIDLHVFDGAQITIYLEENGKSVLDGVTAEKMIKSIDAILIENGIRLGKQPDSDIRTRSNYFSLRNDKGIILETGENLDIEHQINYISARLVGTHYNPANHPNPFQLLLDQKKSVFNPLEHFEAFCLTSEHRIKLAFFMTVVAFLNEHTHVESHEELSEIRKKLSDKNPDAYRIKGSFDDEDDFDEEDDVVDEKKKDLLQITKVIVLAIDCFYPTGEIENLQLPYRYCGDSFEELLCTVKRQIGILEPSLIQKKLGNDSKAKKISPENYPPVEIAEEMRFFTPALHSGKKADQLSDPTNSSSSKSTPSATQTNSSLNL